MLVPRFGGGTDINSALAYCEKQIEITTKTHLVLITDLYEGSDANSTLTPVGLPPTEHASLFFLDTLSVEKVPVGQIELEIVFKGHAFDDAFGKAPGR